ncbi:hypothetical protein ACUN9V_05060 [Salinicola sp. V024]|uniref:hypothetical protein n=1 Tax=Salinicola sp. V024 TaxID=3459609 RepID=UPI004044FB65
MSRSNWEHVGFALLIMITLSALLALIGVESPVLIGFAVAVTWFIARECTQHEYKLGVHRGWTWGETLPVKWWEGIAKGWTRDSLLDWLAPLIACLLLLIALSLLPAPS